MESEKSNHFPTREISVIVVPRTCFENDAADNGSTVRSQFILTDRISRPSTPRARSCRAIVSTSGSSGIILLYKNFPLTTVRQWRTNVFLMIFKETNVFTRQIRKLIPDDEYREFQQELIFNPAAGAVIKGSGGLRKIRWRSASKGKRGGIRIIYYWYMADHEIYLLLAYGKNEKGDLTPKETKILRHLVEENMP